MSGLLVKLFGWGYGMAGIVHDNIEYWVLSSANCPDFLFETLYQRCQVWHVDEIALNQH